MLDPVKLVGMSEGAKKRAARLELISLMYGSSLSTTCPKERRSLLRNWGNDLNLPTARSRYGFLCADYRIGERLAPCRYCRGPALYDHCKGWRIAQHILGGHIRGECAFCRTCAEAKNTLRVIPYDVCDGSGVVPAKNVKK